MKHLIIIILLVFVSSCSNDQQQIPKKTTQCNLSNPKIVEIDSCEYIQYHNYLYESITHKGNCKYCIERNKKCTQ